METFKLKKKYILIVFALAIGLTTTTISSADSRAFFQSNVDWETRKLIDHEFEKDVGRRLGHTIDEHYGRGSGYLKGRCKIGPKTVGNVTIQNYKSSYGNDGWQVVRNVRDQLFANRSAIFNFSRNENYRGRTVAYRNRLLDGGGEKYVRCTGAGTGSVANIDYRLADTKFVVRNSIGSGIEHNSTSVKWFLNTSFPALKSSL